MSELDPFNGDTDACLAHINLQKFPVKELPFRKPYLDWVR